MQSYCTTINTGQTADWPRRQKYSYTMLITSEFHSSAWHGFHSFHSLVCSWQPPLVFMNWPFNYIQLAQRMIQPQLMQTTLSTGVYTRQLHKHKHVLTLSAVTEAKAWNLGESERAHFPFIHSRHVLGIILGVWTHRIWYYFRTVIINHLISSERMDRVFWTARPFLKLHTRCWGHLSLPDMQKMKSQSNEGPVWLRAPSAVPSHSCRHWPQNGLKWESE